MDLSRGVLIIDRPTEKVEISILSIIRILIMLYEPNYDYNIENVICF